MALNKSIKPIFHCNAKLLASGLRVKLGEISHWVSPQLPTCWYLKSFMESTPTLKFALPPTPTLKFALPPTPTPNASRWNIGGIGSPKQNSCVGHVDFMLFVSISFVLVSQLELSFQLHMSLRVLNRFSESSGHTFVETFIVVVPLCVVHLSGRRGSLYWAHFPPRSLRSSRSSSADGTCFWQPARTNRPTKTRLQSSSFHRSIETSFRQGKSRISYIGQ